MMSVTVTLHHHTIVMTTFSFVNRVISHKQYDSVLSVAFQIHARLVKVSCMTMKTNLGIRDKERAILLSSSFRG